MISEEGRVVCTSAEDTRLATNSVSVTLKSSESFSQIRRQLQVIVSMCEISVMPTGYGLSMAEETELNSRQEQEIFSSQSLEQLCSSLWVKWPGREARHSSASNAEAKNGARTSLPPQYMSMAWCLINFTFSKQYGGSHRNRPAELHRRS
jgi:hypothetical protein